VPVSLSTEVSLAVRIVGLTLWGAGMVAVLWGRWTLGTMMGLSTSSATQLRADHRLIQHGAYALVRHPMYLGYWLVVGGLFVMYHTWTPLLILLMTVPALIRRAQREEEALQARFGSEWRVYAARVPMFVPRLR
jgi:protein-S-isoprenylcysteine O-methyltransferase Ste14